MPANGPRGAAGAGDWTEADRFELALRVFELFTLPEKQICLAEFARLRIPETQERFFEAVHRVITRSKTVSG